MKAESEIKNSAGQSGPIVSPHTCIHRRNPNLLNMSPNKRPEQPPVDDDEPDEWYVLTYPFVQLETHKMKG